MCTAPHRAGISLTQAGRLTWILCPGWQVFEILLSRGYSENNFREDLKNLYLKLGIENKMMIFLFTDAHVAEEGFLELINNMLTSGTTGAGLAGAWLALQARSDGGHGGAGQVNCAGSSAKVGGAHVGGSELVEGPHLAGPVGHLKEIRLCSPSSDLSTFPFLKDPSGRSEGAASEGDKSRKGCQFGATVKVQGRDE